MHLHFHIFAGKRLGPMIAGGPMPPSTATDPRETIDSPRVWAQA